MKFLLCLIEVSIQKMLPVALKLPISICWHRQNVTYRRQAGEMAFKNAAFGTAIYHFTIAISHFPLDTWTTGFPSGNFVLTLGYDLICHAHSLLCRGLLAENDYQTSRGVAENVLPHVSHIPEHSATFLSIIVKSWIGDKYRRCHSKLM
jgi:hypothetical protein